MFNCFHGFKVLYFQEQRKYRLVTTVCQQDVGVSKFSKDKFGH